jgi:diadenosine tetraphosphate (Ap4A) HIT family hydrolase
VWERRSPIDLREAMQSTRVCPFCTLVPGQEISRNEYAVALGDRYPITEGHTLVVPLRHVESIFDLSEAELRALARLVVQVRRELGGRLRPDGFTIGVNDGSAAGQTVPHAHVHVIPRSRGDVPDPRGGIRWVVPDRAAYWEAG